MTFQRPTPGEPDGPRSPEEETQVRLQALRIGAELQRRGMRWVIGPASGRLEGDPYALYHIYDAADQKLAFNTLDDLEEWLKETSGGAPAE